MARRIGSGRFGWFWADGSWEAEAPGCGRLEACPTAGRAQRAHKRSGWEPNRICSRGAGPARGKRVRKSGDGGAREGAKGIEGAGAVIRSGFFGG